MTLTNHTFISFGIVTCSSQLGGSTGSRIIVYILGEPVPFIWVYLVNIRIGQYSITLNL